MWSYNYSDELCHFGVKGMKWGRRKAPSVDKAYRNVKRAKSDYKKAKSNYKKELNSDNKKYTKDDRMSDRILYGNGGVKRINKRMNKGDSYTKAFVKESGRQFVTGALLAGGFGAYKLSKKIGAKNTGRLAASAILSMMGHRNIKWYD